MRTTLDLDEELIAQARAYIPELSKTALLEEGLRALIRREACRRLLDAAGAQPDLLPPPRWRPG